LADAVGLSVLQVHRYEGGASQPTLDTIRRLAVALGVSADALVFDEGERGPDEALRYQFETISRMSEHEQQLARELLDALIVKSQVTGAIARVTAAETAERKPRKGR
jgi:transcriptional regulator with XRE-family HTH domain